MEKKQSTTYNELPFNHKLIISYINDFGEINESMLREVLHLDLISISEIIKELINIKYIKIINNKIIISDNIKNEIMPFKTLYFNSLYWFEEYRNEKFNWNYSYLPKKVIK